MKSPRRRAIAFYVYGGSLLLHAALAIGTVVMPSPKTSVATAITLVEEKKKKEPPRPAPLPPPPPPKAEDKPKPRPAPQPQQQQQAKVVAEAKPEAPPPMPVDNGGFADLGVSLGNADGPGIAVPGAAAATATASAKGPGAGPAATTHKVQQLDAPTQGTAACSEPVVRPKVKVGIVPKYTIQARQAEIEGVVRVQVTVDESGHVLSARVVSGLGYGLDETAIAAAKSITFQPATQCGKPVVGTTIVPFRFELT